MKYAVIPAYEPGKTLIDLVRGMKRQGFEILVVDDGSGAAYAKTFKDVELYADVLSCPVNRGKGYALKMAFSQIQGRVRDGDTIVTLDCDGQHRVEDAVRLSAAATLEPATLFIGSRKQSTGSPLRSRFGNAVTRLVFRLTSGIPVYDTQTGLRAFTADFLPTAIQIPGERYEYEMNALLYCARHGVSVRELPIETVYIDGNAGSHFHVLRDSWQIYREILKFSLSSLLGFVVDYTLYSVLSLLGTVPIAANIAARCVSASVNFSVNRRYVFQDSGSLWTSAFRYFALALGILVCNSAILYALTTGLGINPYLAKVLTELLLFLCSFLIQKHVVFSIHSHRRRCEQL